MTRMGVQEAARMGAVHGLLRAAADQAQQHAWTTAAARLEEALEQAGPSAQACGLVGDACSAAAEYALAARSYDRALALDPAQPHWWFNRATVRRFLGDLVGAETDYDACIGLAPDDGLAWLNRSELRPQSPQHNHVAALEARVARGFSGWEQEVPLRFALAKEYEDLGDHRAAWTQLTRGAGLRRAHLQYAVAQDVATVDWLIDAFPVGQPRRPGHPSTAPIFVLGMPRTGSTLVDRILSSHSGIRSAGELPDFGQAVVAAARGALAAGSGSGVVDRRGLVFASAGVDPAALGADYLARSARWHGTHRHFTDKLPLNHLYCGLIDLALPNARMIHVERHPLATCYGVFKVLFQQGYPFSYDLGEIAEYFIAYRRLMAHWEARLPGRLISVSYEALVANPEATSRTLIAGLELPWEPACLEFHRNPSPTTTASAAQVRRPIYTSALHLWQHYEAELAPVRRRLEAAGIACD